MAGMAVRSLVGSSTMGTFVASGNARDLAYLQPLLADGTLRSQIDRVVPFSQVVEAIRYLEQGRARGKVVVVMPPG
jgi:NADPH:quinone reductase-like Zn-dependent oxidoreductase